MTLQSTLGSILTRMDGRIFLRNVIDSLEALSPPPVDGIQVGAKPAACRDTAVLKYHQTFNIRRTKVII